MYELRKYHGDRVMSLTYDDDDRSFSVGILAPGEYEFGSIRKEIFTVTSGEISVKVDADEDWMSFGANETFNVPEYKNFSLKVENVSSYICHYD